MKCDVSFHKVAQVHYLGEVSMFLCMCENVLHAYSSEKLQKSKSFPRVMITMYCRVFMNHSVDLYIRVHCHLNTSCKTDSATW